MKVEDKTMKVEGIFSCIAAGARQGQHSSDDIVCIGRMEGSCFCDCV